MRYLMRYLLSLVFVLAGSRVALACPVCFGESDAPLAQAMNNGILVMLGVVVAVLAGFGAFIFYLARRARLMEIAGQFETSDGMVKAEWSR